MSYPALPDQRMPYDNDGTVIAVGNDYQGITSYPSQARLQYAQGLNAVAGAYNDNNPGGITWTTPSGSYARVWLFFPEAREVTAVYAQSGQSLGGVGPNAYGNGSFGGITNDACRITAIAGSNDSTNGQDGTWETASLPQGAPTVPAPDLFAWRSGIKAVSFTGGKRVVRITFGSYDRNYGSTFYVPLLHLYGEKVAGQTPDDLLYIDHDTTPGVEYQAPEDFGDRPLGTSVVRQFRIKNSSASKTANAINVQCNDADFVISTDGVTWVVTINISSLGPGAESATLYVRNTTPGVGTVLGPRFARIVTIAGSWT